MDIAVKILILDISEIWSGGKFKVLPNFKKLKDFCEHYHFEIL